MIFLTSASLDKNNNRGTTFTKKMLAALSLIILVLQIYTLQELTLAALHNHKKNIFLFLKKHNLNSSLNSGKNKIKYEKAAEIAR